METGKGGPVAELMSGPLGGLNGLILGAIVFAAVHLLVAGKPLRGALVERLGDKPYQGAFSLLSIIGLAWMIYGYGGTQPVLLWSVPDVLIPLFSVDILVAFIFVVAGLTVKSPTMMGGEQALSEGDAAIGFLRIISHPMMWGIILWAFAHLVMNGDTRSLILFGTLLLVAAMGPIQIDKRRAAAFGENWEKFASVTSNVPFAAILQDRNTLNLGELGLWRIALGCVLFAVAYYFHAEIAGVSLF